jgi:hypothetical protein
VFKGFGGGGGRRLPHPSRSNADDEARGGCGTPAGATLRACGRGP